MSISPTLQTTCRNRKHPNLSPLSPGPTPEDLTFQALQEANERAMQSNQRVEQLERELQLKDRELQLKDRELQVTKRELQVTKRELQAANRDTEDANRRAERDASLVKAWREDDIKQYHSDKIELLKVKAERRHLRGIAKNHAGLACLAAILCLVLVPIGIWVPFGIPAMNPTVFTAGCTAAVLAGKSVRDALNSLEESQAKFDYEHSLEKDSGNIYARLQSQCQYRLY